MNTCGPETLTIKYLGKSHKFMVTNAIHGNIRKLFRKTSTVATFDDFVQLCEKANNNIKTTVLDLLFTYPIFKKSTHKIIDQSKNASYGNYSSGSIQKRKQHITLQRILPRRKLYHRQLFVTFFLKKRWLESFPYTER